MLTLGLSLHLDLETYVVVSRFGDVDHEILDCIDPETLGILVLNSALTISDEEIRYDSRNLDRN